MCRIAIRRCFSPYARSALSDTCIFRRVKQQDVQLGSGAERVAQWIWKA
jgi:hypothetical protein